MAIIRSQNKNRQGVACRWGKVRGTEGRGLVHRDERRIGANDRALGIRDKRGRGRERVIRDRGGY